MTYKIIGNKDYEINEKREIARVDGGKLDLLQSNDSVTITLYGYTKTVKKEWLYWLSFFKLELPTGYKDRVFDYEFKENGALKYFRVDPVITIFKKPVYMDNDKKYRLIARFPNYAITANGVLLNLKTKTSHRILSKVFNYPRISVKDQAGLYSTRLQQIHRLVALTWVKNDDFVKYSIVDHRDNDKTNYIHTNLRWVTYVVNNRAAIATGCRTDNHFVVTRNIDTNEVKEHASLTDASVHIGRSRINSTHTPLEHNKMWKGKNGNFEIKLKSDNRPWYFIDGKVQPKSNTPYHILITNEDGSTVTYVDMAKFAKEELGWVRSSSIEQKVEYFKKRYPKRKIKLTQLFQQKRSNGVEARNVKTGEVFRADTDKALALKIGLSKSSVNKYSKTQGKQLIGDYQIRIPDGTEWFETPTNTVKNQSQQIQLVDTITGDVKVFNSLRSISRYLVVDKKTIQRTLRSDGIFRNKYQIKYL